MGSKCCKRICCQLDTKSGDSLVDYKGLPVNLTEDFEEMSDTSSSSDDDFDGDDLDKGRLVKPPSSNALSIDLGTHERGKTNVERKKLGDGKYVKLVASANVEKMKQHSRKHATRKARALP